MNGSETILLDELDWSHYSRSSSKVSEISLNSEATIVMLKAIAKNYTKLRWIWLRFFLHAVSVRCLAAKPLRKKRQLTKSKYIYDRNTFVQLEQKNNSCALQISPKKLPGQIDSLNALKPVLAVQLTRLTGIYYLLTRLAFLGALEEAREPNFAELVALTLTRRPNQLLAQ